MRSPFRWRELARHPLRTIRRVENGAPVSMDAGFGRLYAADGRPAIAPEPLLRASPFRSVFSIRSERRMQDNLLFRRLVGVDIHGPVRVAKGSPCSATPE